MVVWQVSFFQFKGKLTIFFMMNIYMKWANALSHHVFLAMHKLT